MAFSTIRQLRPDESPEVTRSQDQLRGDLRAPLSCELVKGRRVASVKASGAGNLTVYHLLGRLPKGWFVMSPQGAAPAVYEVVGTRTDKALTLNFSAAATVDLWVF